MNTVFAGDRCPTCQRSLEAEELTPEQVSEKLNNLEPVAVTVLAKQLDSMNETVAQRAAKLLLEWSRGKPQTTIHQTVDAVTAIRYESAAWMPEGDVVANRLSEDPPLVELPSGE